MKYGKMEATLDFAYSDFGGQIVKKALLKDVRGGIWVKQLLQGLLLWEAEK